MRIVLAAIVALPVWALPVMAYENFIPLGHNYSPDNPELPALNSDEDLLNSQVDVYESEIYNRQRAAKAFSSEIDRFTNDQEPAGSSDFIDY